MFLFWGKRARQQVISTQHANGDGQVITEALNLQIPDNLEDFLDELDEEQYLKLHHAVLDSKRATKVLNLFQDEIAITTAVEDTE